MGTVKIGNTELNKQPTNPLSFKIKDGSVTEVKIADGAVSKNKIADGSVTSNKVENNAITNTKIANEAVSTRNLLVFELLQIPLAEDKTFDAITEQEVEYYFGSVEAVTNAIEQKASFKVNDQIVVPAESEYGATFGFTVNGCYHIFSIELEHAGRFGEIPFQCYLGSKRIAYRENIEEVIVNSLPAASEDLRGKVYLIKSNADGSTYSKGTLLETSHNTHDWSNDGCGILPESTNKVFLLNTYDKHIYDKVVVEYLPTSTLVFNALVVTPDLENVGLYEYDVANTKKVTVEDLSNMLLRNDDSKKVYAWVPVPGAVIINDTLSVYTGNLEKSNKYDKYIVVEKEGEYEWELINEVEESPTTEEILSLFT